MRWQQQQLPGGSLLSLDFPSPIFSGVPGVFCRFGSRFFAICCVFFFLRHLAMLLACRSFVSVFFTVCMRWWSKRTGHHFSCLSLIAGHGCVLPRIKASALEVDSKYKSTLTLSPPSSHHRTLFCSFLRDDIAACSAQSNKCITIQHKERSLKLMEIKS